MVLWFFGIDENPLGNEEHPYFVKITNLQNKCFLFENNVNAKLMKVSFHILTSFLNKVGQDNNKCSLLKIYFC